MLRKRSRAVEKEQGKIMPDSSSTSDCFGSSDGAAQKAKSNSFFSVPRLFVGFGTKYLSDCDAVRSPTSPLDYRVLSSLGSSFLGSPRSPGLDAKPKCWDTSRVGLGLVDTLNDENKPSGNVFSESMKSILFAPQTRINASTPKSHLEEVRHENQFTSAAPRSLPKDYLVLSRKLQQSSVEKRPLESKLNISDCSESGIQQSSSADVKGSSLPASRFLYHCPKPTFNVQKSESKNLFKVDSTNFVKEKDNFEVSIPKLVDSSHERVTVLSANDIEQSEDYTCITSHGPNPRTTRIFGDFILESSSTDSQGLKCNNGTQGETSLWLLKPTEETLLRSAGDFLSFCFACNRKLEEGKDIYMYRGEKAFCSCDCRDREILNEEEMEKCRNKSSDYADSLFREEMFLGA